jgi:hypothetical protein
MSKQPSCYCLGWIVRACGKTSTVHFPSSMVGFSARCRTPIVRRNVKPCSVGAFSIWRLYERPRQTASNAQGATYQEGRAEAVQAAAGWRAWLIVQPNQYTEDPRVSKAVDEFLKHPRRTKARERRKQHSAKQLARYYGERLHQR